MFQCVKRFQVGQKVNLRSTDRGDQVRIWPTEAGQKVVVNVAEDHIVLEDESAGVRLRIPVHYIKYTSAEPAA